MRSLDDLGRSSEAKDSKIKKWRDGQTDTPTKQVVEPLSTQLKKCCDSLLRRESKAGEGGIKKWPLALESHRKGFSF